MAYLLDTNIVIRWLFAHEPLYPVVTAAVDVLQESGEDLYIASQVIVEYWNVATRPILNNGYGLPIAQVRQDVERVISAFHLAPDNPQVFIDWLYLVESVGVSRVQVHDARLAAAMRVHGITHLLTLIPGDFRRYPGIKVETPQMMMPEA